MGYRRHRAVALDAQSDSHAGCTRRCPGARASADRRIVGRLHRRAAATGASARSAHHAVAAHRRATGADLPRMGAVCQPYLSADAGRAADGAGIAHPTGSVAPALEVRGMIPFDQQLRAIVAAIAFMSPDSARVTNLRGAARDVFVAGERDHFSGLTVALYMDHYSLLPSDAAPASMNGGDFLSSLQAANPIALRYEA